MRNLIIKNNESRTGRPVFLMLVKVSRTNCRKRHEAIREWREYLMAELREADRAILAEMMNNLRFMLCECVKKEEREYESEGWMCDGWPSTGSGTWLKVEVQRGGEMGVMVGRKRGKDPRLRQRMERRKAA